MLSSSLVNLAPCLFLLPLFKWWSRSPLGREDRLNLSLVFTVSESVNWTDWSVDSSDCQEYCSEKGGTVTASRQCYSHSKKLEAKVCTEHDNSTKVVKCGDEHCPVSGLFHDLFHLVRKNEGWELIPHIDHTLKKSPLNFFRRSCSTMLPRALLGCVRDKNACKRKPLGLSTWPRSESHGWLSPDLLKLNKAYIKDSSSTESRQLRAHDPSK